MVVSVRSSLGKEIRVLKGSVKRRQPKLDEKPSVSDCSTATSTSTETGCCTQQSSSPFDSEAYIRERAEVAWQLPLQYAHEEDAYIYLSQAAAILSFHGDCYVQMSPKYECFIEPLASKSKVTLDLAEKVGAAFRPKRPSYILALCYLRRIAAKSAFINFSLNSTTYYRLVCGILLVATKFFDDLYYRNTFYAENLGLTLADINTIEREILNMLDYGLKITGEDYRKMAEEFDAARYRICNQAGLPVMCGHYTLPAPPEVLLYANTYGFAKTMTTLADSNDCVALDLQDSLYSRQDGTARIQTESERLLASALRSKSNHITTLLQQAVTAVLKRRA